MKPHYKIFLDGIIRAGTTQSAIAVYIGVRPASVGRVVHGHMRSQRIEAELSKFIGMPVVIAPRKKTTVTPSPPTPRKRGRPAHVLLVTSAELH